VVDGVADPVDAAVEVVGGTVGEPAVGGCWFAQDAVDATTAAAKTLLGRGPYHSQPCWPPDLNGVTDARHIDQDPLTWV
jgi:hypothetical protein